MKVSAVALWVAACTLLLPVHAERPSTDRLAVDSGLFSWFSAWNTERPETRPAQLQVLYAQDVVTRGGDGPKKGWAEYEPAVRDFGSRYPKMNAAWPEDLEIRITGDQAVTTFTLHPRLITPDGREETATTRVRLVWRKSDALWRIAEQQFDCSGPRDVADAAPGR